MTGWSREEALFADREDAQRRQHWRARERRRQRLLAGLGLFAGVVGIGLWWLHGPALPALAFQSPFSEPALRSSEPRLQAPAERLAERPSQPAFQTPPASRPVAQQPPTLQDCLADDNLIDERVIACRFGELPRSEGIQPARGMVSERYLAEYRLQKAAERREPRQRTTEIDNEVRFIPAWDGNGRYTAHWQAVNNRIDGTSVCDNQRQGSIEYRECRKGAKVWFREMCRRAGVSAHLRERYCSAASAFSPM